MLYLGQPLALLAHHGGEAAKPVAFEDLGIEAIYELDVEGMAVIVAVDRQGNSIHRIGPAQWRRTPEPA
ncbi:fumarate hydratase C-terminal domain-containing protein [Jannaschia ovalis]|uniref:Fumarate hydratase C-terminal domain-containing protein n=1 Tax=Jannaschia ovalis TaxID=3038773 RepID=A0ABY8LBC4_9RHOB|nr:fumarate hydratase C-terminal domain-containing protein [Jannaschia sp. GRR-S6-38]WGH78640.1 fumarate hydratase C-terminal domain-containing protein [Jannaschia sp. GRR-S6-38]